MEEQELDQGLDHYNVKSGEALPFYPTDLDWAMLREARAKENARTIATVLGQSPPFVRTFPIVLPDDVVEQVAWYAVNEGEEALEPVNDKDKIMFLEQEYRENLDVEVVSDELGDQYSQKVEYKGEEYWWVKDKRTDQWYKNVGNSFFVVVDHNLRKELSKELGERSEELQQKDWLRIGLIALFLIMAGIITLWILW